MYGSKHEEIRHARKEMTPNRNGTLNKLKEEVKTRLFSVYGKPRKQTQVGLIYHAKMAWSMALKHANRGSFGRPRKLVKRTKGERVTPL